ncbi:MAG: hypothetical protein R2744_03110 [Bacteroidales bacterium]
MIDPGDYFIKQEPARNTGFTRIAGSGNPATSLDIAFIAEGYTSGEMQKFGMM